MPCIPNRYWPAAERCHLFGDDPRELHQFAFRLGLTPCDFEGDGVPPSYNLTAMRRAEAVAAGATEVSLQQFREHRQALLLQLGDPAGA